MEKMVKEWIKELPKETQEAFVKNTQEIFGENTERELSSIEPTLSRTLRRYFFWSRTPEGNDFWENLHNKVLAKEMLLQEIPTKSE